MGNKQLLRITKELAREGSPIHKWPVVLVEKSLRHQSADGILAEVRTTFPLTLKDLDPRILEMLKLMMPKLVDHALGLHGEAGAGKTPLARMVAMALSRWWIKKDKREDEHIQASFRQASEFDFFRGQSGSRIRPDIFDDGSLNE